MTRNERHSQDCCLGLGVDMPAESVVAQTLAFVAGLEIRCSYRIHSVGEVSGIVEQ